jgi:hypothetical protein
MAGAGLPRQPTARSCQTTMLSQSLHPRAAIFRRLDVPNAISDQIQHLTGRIRRISAPARADWCKPEMPRDHIKHLRDHIQSLRPLDAVLHACTAPCQTTRNLL